MVRTVGVGPSGEMRGGTGCCNGVDLVTDIPGLVGGNGA